MSRVCKKSKIPYFLVKTTTNCFREATLSSFSNVCVSSNGSAERNINFSNTNQSKAIYFFFWHNMVLRLSSFPVCLRRQQQISKQTLEPFREFGKQERFMEKTQKHYWKRYPPQKKTCGRKPKELPVFKFQSFRQDEVSSDITELIANVTRAFDTYSPI